jgi:YD repeat-containing protein
LKELRIPASSENVDYDNLGRVTRSLHGIAGSPSFYQFDYLYYLNDAIKTVTNPSGRVITYDVEDAGLISKVSGLLSSTPTVYADLTVNAPPSMALPWHYTADGRLAQMKLGNNLWETRIYQTPDLPTFYRVGTGTGAGNDRLQLQYNFSPTQNNGNLVSQVIQRPEGAWSQSFSYDNLNRLTGITEPSAGGAGWNRSYGYDRYGNRWVVKPNPSDLLPFETHEPTAESNFNALTNHLSVANSWHDLAGNQRYFAPWTLYYDAENRNVRNLNEGTDSEFPCPYAT